MYKITIVKQSHAGDDFTPEGDTFTASNGFMIKSIAFPAVNTLRNTLYVYGESRLKYLSTIYDSFLVGAQNLEALVALKDAVAEYNKKYGNPKATHKYTAVRNYTIILNTESYE